MKKHSSSIKLIVLTPLFIFVVGLQSCNHKTVNLEKVALLDKKLNDLAIKTDHPFFFAHLRSIQQVIDVEESISKEEAEVLDSMYRVFLNDSLANPSEFGSYLDRKRSLILAWTSPTDSTVSLSWLRLPKDWNPEKAYPLYVELHGYWDVADQPIDFMSHAFTAKPSTSIAFEDGYLLSPWGRGNKRYHGISKTDVWEAVAQLESIARIDATRKYLLGHSMGGYGTWHIAQESASIWAAIGVYSGSLFYENERYVTPQYAKKLKNTPTYFVWGKTEDRTLREANKKAYELLRGAGNQHIFLTEFDGGHVYDEVNVEKMYRWLRTFRKTME